MILIDFFTGKLRKLLYKIVSKRTYDKKQDVLDYLTKCGVETKYGYVTLFGKPIINKVQGARIIMGKGVVLVSSNDENGIVYNPAGINHPVMLSAIVPGSTIIIGDNVGISGSSIVATKKVLIGSNSMLGNNTNVYDTDFHCINPQERLRQSYVLEAKSKPVIIGSNCWIGSGSTILKGVTIGDNSVIGAMSLVNKTIPNNVLAAGNPIKKIRNI